MKKLLLTGIALVGAALVFAQPRLVAHRGFYTTPGSDENTISSLINAQQLGVYGVEFDVNRTSDGELIVVHYSLNIFSEIPIYRLSLYIRYLQIFSFGLNTHEISRF